MLFWGDKGGKESVRLGDGRRARSAGGFHSAWREKTASRRAAASFPELGSGTEPRGRSREESKGVRGVHVRGEPVKTDKSHRCESRDRARFHTCFVWGRGSIRLSAGNYRFDQHWLKQSTVADFPPSIFLEVGIRFSVLSSTLAFAVLQPHHAQCSLCFLLIVASQSQDCCYSNRRCICLPGKKREGRPTQLRPRDGSFWPPANTGSRGHL